MTKRKWLWQRKGEISRKEVKSGKWKRIQTKTDNQKQRMTRERYIKKRQISGSGGGVERHKEEMETGEKTRGKKKGKKGKRREAGGALMLFSSYLIQAIFKSANIGCSIVNVSFMHLGLSNGEGGGGGGGWERQGGGELG